jgi:hypothetical protein
MKRKNRRILDENGQWTYKCNRCDLYKISDEFHNDKSKPPFFLGYTCKNCRKLKLDYEPVVTEDMRIEMDKILSNLGFDLEQNIHEQFQLKIFEKYKIKI